MSNKIHAPAAAAPKTSRKIHRTKVEPKVLRWVRERAGLSVDDLVSAFPKYREWEAGTADPTLRQLQKLAGKYYLPLFCLSGKEPPTELLNEPPIADLRSEESGGGNVVSLNLLDSIFDCKYRQTWYKEDYVPFAGLDTLGFVGSESPQGDPESVAFRMRGLVGPDISEAKEASSVDDAFASFVSKAEETGIMVMVSGIVGSNTRRRLDPGEFRGFSLSDPVAPLTFVNATVSKPARMFALAHGLAHLWLGKTALFDAIPYVKGSNRTERWCNRVAAELLVPLQDLQDEFDRESGLQDEAVRLAKLYKVSATVIAHRLRDARLITKGRLDGLIGTGLDKLVHHGRSRRSGAGGSFFRNQIGRLGRRFSKAIVELDSQDRISHKDTIRLLEVYRGKSFDRFVEELNETG